MRKLFVLAAAAQLIAGCHMGQVKVPLDDNYTQYRWTKKLDCAVHKDKARRLSLGFQIGTPFGVNAGPEIGFSKSTKMKWDHAAQQIIARYQELCGRYNSGTISMASYDRRIREIDQIYEKMLRLKREVAEYHRRIAQAAFAELDKEIDKQRARQQVQQLSTKIDDISKQASALEGLK